VEQDVGAEDDQPVHLRRNVDGAPGAEGVAAEEPAVGWEPVGVGVVHRRHPPSVLRQPRCGGGVGGTDSKDKERAEVGVGAVSAVNQPDVHRSKGS